MQSYPKASLNCQGQHLCNRIIWDLWRHLISSTTPPNATLTTCGTVCEDEWSLLVSLWTLQLSVSKFRLIVLYELEKFLHDPYLWFAQSHVMIACFNTIGRGFLRMALYRIAPPLAGMLVLLLQDLLLT